MGQADLEIGASGKTQKLDIMKTNLQIKRRAFGKFLKAKVAEFANSTMEIVRNRASESILITSPFNPFEALSPGIGLLYLHFGVDEPQQAKTEVLKWKLILTASTLKLHVRLLSKSGSG